MKWLFNQGNCQHVPTGCVDMEYVLKYDHFLWSSTNVPKHKARILWTCKLCTVTVFERSEKHTLLDTVQESINS